MPEAGPTPAGIRNALLGGTVNYAADREAAAGLEARFPGAAALARANRDFAKGATTWLASRGVRQFADLGCGLPRPPGPAEAAREAHPDARVACVDGDPHVTGHLRCAARRGGWAVVPADPACPAAVLADPGFRAVIDLDQPAGVLLCGTLSTLDADMAREAVRGYAAALAPGSGVAISCISYAGEAAGAAAARAYRETTGGQWHSHPRETIEGFFDAAGLELARARVMDVRCWPLCEVGETRTVAALGGIGLKR